MAVDLSTLCTSVTDLLGEKLVSAEQHLGELTIVIRAASMLQSLKQLRDEAGFDQMIDLCGVDYSTYGDGIWEGQRFAVVYHLLSVSRNARIRVRIFAQDDDFPVMESAADIWPVCNWFEREAFDLYGIVFTNHPDLRRLLTDYGFVGNPFRKDFPLSGHVEMRYDPAQQRVIYEPVTVEPREVTPRIVREPNFASK